MEAQQRPVQRDQDRHLDHQRQAAAHGIDAVITVQSHYGLVHFPGVLALVLALDLLDFRLQLLHLPHGSHLFEVQRGKDELDQNSQKNNGQGVTRNTHVHGQPVKPLQ